MTFNLSSKKTNSDPEQSIDLKAYWDFENDFSDASGNGNELFPFGNPTLVKDSKLSGAVNFDGCNQFLGTKKPVLDTKGSYTIAAWVLLSSSTMKGTLSLNPGEHALTAVSQDTQTHSNFYLGIRQIDKEHPDGILTSSLRWNFTVSPIDGSETGAVEWQHAYSETHLDNTVLDKWFLLVGVCDAVSRSANIYVPTINESGVIYWPDDLVQLPAEGGLNIGRGKWLGKNVDFWPGKVGPIKVFSGAMTQEQAMTLYKEGAL